MAIDEKFQDWNSPAQQKLLAGYSDTVKMRRAYEAGYHQAIKDGLEAILRTMWNPELE